jgi:bacterioferritin (cytochrome b1)
MTDHRSRTDVPPRLGAWATAPGFVSAATTAVDDPSGVIAALNEVSAALRLTALRCEREYLTARHVRCAPLAAAALAHAHDVHGHSARIGARIAVLGGVSDPPADALPDAGPAPVDADDTLRAVIAADLAAMRATVDRCREISATVARYDPATRQLLDDLARGETARAEELAQVSAPIAPRAAH